MDHTQVQVGGEGCYSIPKCKGASFLSCWSIMNKLDLIIQDGYRRTKGIKKGKYQPFLQEVSQKLSPDTCAYIPLTRSQSHGTLRSKKSKKKKHHCLYYCWIHGQLKFRGSLSEEEKGSKYWEKSSLYHCVSQNSEVFQILCILHV